MESAPARPFVLPIHCEACGAETNMLCVDWRPSGPGQLIPYPCPSCGHETRTTAALPRVPDRRTRERAETKADRRRAPRVGLPHPVDAVVVALDLPVTVLEVGFGGVSIQSPRAFQLDEIHDLRCQIDDHEPIVLRARVAHCRCRLVHGEAPRFIAGLEFIHSPEADGRSAVDQLIEQIAEALSADPQP